MGPKGSTMVSACSGSKDGGRFQRSEQDVNGIGSGSLDKTPSAKKARVSEPPEKTKAADGNLEAVYKNGGPTQQPSFFVTPQSKAHATNEVGSQQLSKDELRSLLLTEAGYDFSEQSAKSQKRQKYLGWDDLFFGVAVLSSRRSKDPNSPSGACIVDSDNRIIGIGYDGAPRGCPDDCLPWTDPEKVGPDVPYLHTHKPYGVHAEVNAILNKCSADVAGARMYVERFPCK